MQLNLGTQQTNLIESRTYQDGAVCLNLTRSRLCICLNEAAWFFDIITRFSVFHFMNVMRQVKMSNGRTAIALNLSKQGVWQGIACGLRHGNGPAQPGIGGVLPSMDAVSAAPRARSDPAIWNPKDYCQVSLIKWNAETESLEQFPTVWSWKWHRFTGWIRPTFYQRWWGERYSWHSKHQSE